jgi:hypothetical protein
MNVFNLQSEDDGDLVSIKTKDKTPISTSMLNFKSYSEFAVKYSSFLNKKLQVIDRSKTQIELMKRYISNNRDQNIFLLDKVNEDFIQYELDAQELLKQINRRDFEIAVMGREKMGKSSLINSLLGLNVLPNANARCTYTTTEVRQCLNEEEQKVKIQYMTNHDFESYENSIKSLLNDIKSSADTSNLEKELEEIQLTTNDQNAMGFLDKPDFEKPFKEITEIKSILIENIAKITVARTIKRLTIWLSNKKMKLENVTIYDVPGFDSPTIMHKEQTVQRAATADIIIFVKRLREPTLNETDIEMVRIFDDHNNVFIPFKEKLIVALTFPHDVQTRNKYNSLLNENRVIWKNFNIDAESVITVDASAFTENEEDYKNKIKNDIQGMQIDDGIDKIRNLCTDRIKMTRIKSLKDRYDIIDSHFKETFNTFFRIANEEFPIDQSNEQLKESLENQKRNALFAWWAKQWGRINDDLVKFYDNEIYEKTDPDLYPKNNRFMQEFREKYVEMIEKMTDNTENAKKDVQLRIYKKTGVYNPGSNIVYGEGHAAIRIALSNEIYNKISEIICKELGNIIWRVILKIVDSLYASMWNIEEIKEVLLKDKIVSTKSLLQKQVEVLLLNQSRPAIELFLRTSRHDSRSKLVENNKKSIIMYEMFYTENNEPKLRGLASYLLTGKFTLIDYSSLNFNIDNLEKSPLKETIADIIQEVTDDFQEFLNYMKNSIYYAAGLEDLFNQEVDKIRKIFEYEHQSELKWQNLVFKSINKGNDKIPYDEFELDAVKKGSISKTLKEINDLFHQF